MKKYQQVLMVVAGLALLPVFWLPLWSIGIVAPQYKDGMGMFIGLRDIWGHSEHDIQNINILNHYIGMKPIVAAEVDVLTIMPWVVGGLMVSALLLALLKQRWLIAAWLAAFVVLGTAGMYEFYSWNYDYGHNLSPDAPLKVPGMTYTPPIIGTATLLTIRASAWPSWGTLLIGISFVAALGATGIMENRIAAARRRFVSATAGIAFAAVLLGACARAEATSEVREFPAGEACAYCDGVIGEERFGGELTTRGGDVYRFMSTECMAGFVVAGRVAPEDIRTLKVVDYNHGERLIDAETALFVRSDTRKSPNGLGLLASDEEKIAANLHFFFGGTRLDWTGVLELVRKEWSL